MPNRYVDGALTTAKQIGRRQETFPFDFLGDAYAKILKRRYHVLGSSYTGPNTTARGTYGNLLTYSEQFDNAAWSKAAVTVTANQVANPNDGTVDADKLESTGADGLVGMDFTPASAVPHVFSLWVKAATTVAFGWAAIRVSPAVIVGNDVWTATTEWTRLSGVFTPADTSTHRVYIGGLNRFGTGEIIFAWGAQLERASTAGPYVQVTTAPRSVSAPATDSTDANTNADQFAFLCTETPPADSPLEIGLCEFMRQYARIPATQVEYTSRFVNRPVMDDVSYLGVTVRAVSFDNGATSSIFTSDSAITVIGALPTPATSVTGTQSTAGSAITPDVWSPVVVNVRGGSGNSNFFTTSSRDGIKTAVETGTGLTVAVNKSATKIEILITAGTFLGVECTDTSVAVDGSVSSITITRLQTSAAAQGATLVVTNAVTQSAAPPVSVRTFTTSSSHGGAPGDKVVFWKGVHIVAKSVAITASGTTFTVPIEDVPGKDFSADTCGFSPLASMRVVNGVKNCSIKRSTYFYLPGYTLGITTAADIPNYAVYTDPVTWLQMVYSAPAYAAVEVSAIDRWLGPIYQQIVDEVQMTDAIDTVTP